MNKLVNENSSLRKSIEKSRSQSASFIRKNLEESAIKLPGFRLIKGIIDADSAEMLKTIANQLRSSSDDVVLVLGAAIDGKASLLVMVSDKLVSEKNINAVVIIKEISAEINGGGGGQPFLATAGGKKPEGIKSAIMKAAEYLKNLPEF